MFFVTLILGIITFHLAYLHWYQTRSRFALLFNKFPMLPYKPLIGHVAEFSSNGEKLFPQIRALIKKFDETFATWSAYLGILHVITPEDAEIILSNMKYNTKGVIYSFLKLGLGDGLLISDGEKWQHRRKILTPTFHFNILRRFVEVLGEHSIELVHSIKNENKQNETNILPIVTHETLSSLCETSMGTKLDMNDDIHIKYLEALTGGRSTMVKRVLNPLYYTPLIFSLSPLGMVQRRYVKVMQSFTKTIITKREESFKNSDILDIENNNDDDVGIKKKRLAMLDLLISAKKNRGEIDFEGICEEVDTFMAAGHETTAIAISMTLMLLAHHEDVQAKIIKELDDIFEEDDRPASYEDLTKMKYLELCIKESLRLYPSAPLITRRNPIEIELTNNTAPADCEVLIHIYDIHRNEKYFPDPEKFDPDRFLPENCKGRHPFAYIPFSAGPRNCIGQKFALLEMKSFISAIFRHFTLKPVTKFEELRFVVDVALRINGPINVEFIPRT